MKITRPRILKRSHGCPTDRHLYSNSWALHSKKNARRSDEPPMPAHQSDLAPQSSRELEQPLSYLQSKQKVCLHIDLRLLRPSILALMPFHFKTAHFRPVLVIRTELLTLIRRGAG
jgi:hypothetical protein